MKKGFDFYYELEKESQKDNMFSDERNYRQSYDPYGNYQNGEYEGENPNTTFDTQVQSDNFDFTKYLMQGETIFWQGNSKKGGGIFSSLSIFQILFYVIFLFMSLFITWIMISTGGFPVIFLLLFWAIALSGVCKSIAYTHRNYAITNCRVIIVNRDKVSNEYFDKIKKARVTMGKNQIGSVLYVTNDRRYISDVDGHDRWENRTGGIYHVENPHQVLNVLENALENYKNKYDQ